MQLHLWISLWQQPVIIASAGTMWASEGSVKYASQRGKIGLGFCNIWLGFRRFRDFMILRQTICFHLLKVFAPLQTGDVVDSCHSPFVPGDAEWEIKAWKHSWRWACKIQSKPSQSCIFGSYEDMGGLGQENLGLLGTRGEVDGVGCD